MSERPCVFCDIIARREPAEILYEDEELIAFRNRLRWVPVMLIVAPKVHMIQDDLWGDLMAKAGPVAVQLGDKYSPGGFRLVSNFGYDAMQSQAHAHLHIVGGMKLGEYA
jgi:histidine triad (HIT) family protein